MIQDDDTVISGVSEAFHELWATVHINHGFQNRYERDPQFYFPLQGTKPENGQHSIC